LQSMLALRTTHVHARGRRNERCTLVVSTCHCATHVCMRHVCMHHTRSCSVWAGLGGAAGGTS
jgi:hypothetical protein